MKYGMFIGEMLSDNLRTRRTTWQDLYAYSHQELLSSLMEAMGEPTSEMSQKWVVVWAGADMKASELKRDFERQRAESQLMKRFEERGFQVDCTFQEKQNLVCIAAHHGSHLGLKEWLRKEESWPEHFRGDFSSFVEAVWATLPAPSEFGVMLRGTVSSYYLSKLSEGNPSEPEHIRIGLGSYLRSMWTLIWTAILHPFTTTVIDLSTGKRIAELSVPFHEWERKGVALTVKRSQ